MAENGFLLSGAFVDALATNLQNSNGYSKGAAGTSNAILENGDKLLVRLVASAPDEGDFAVYTAESVQLNEEGTGYESTAVIRTYDGGTDGSETNYPAYIYERNKTKGLKDSVHEVTYEYVYALSEDRLVFSAASGGTRPIVNILELVDESQQLYKGNIYAELSGGTPLNPELILIRINAVYGNFALVGDFTDIFGTDARVFSDVSGTMDDPDYEPPVPNDPVEPVPQLPVYWIAVAGFA